MDAIEGLKNRLRNEMSTRIDDSDIVDILEVLQEVDEEIELVKGAYEDRVSDIKSLEEALREIDTHIRSTSEPIPYIVKVLKATLPEYHKDYF